MRAVVQRVRRASVAVDGTITGAIGPGLLVLLGITHTDDDTVADRMAGKLAALRVFAGPDGRMDQALGPDRRILVVSQFTLYGDVSRGHRPSWVAAARPAQAAPLYERVCEGLGAARGVFGADMQVTLVNDGPVTLVVDVP